MKANKALKRLAKIEALISDVAARFSASAPDLREALKNLKAAALSVKEAVKVQSLPALDQAAHNKASGTGKKTVKQPTKAKTGKKRLPEIR